MNTKVNIVATLLLCCLLGASEAFHRRHHRRSGRQRAMIFHDICNESQPENSMGLDACYGCFYRTIFVPGAFPKLAQISSCSDKYVTNPNYDQCKTDLRTATANPDANSSPAVVFCTFMTCISEANKKTLESLEQLVRAFGDASKEGRVAAEKKRTALVLSNKLERVGRFCAAVTNAVRENNFRGGQMRRWNHRRSFRHNFYQEQMMRSPRNVFQFFVDTPVPRQAFRHYYRTPFGEDRGYGSGYNRFQTRRRHFHLQ